MLAKFSQAVNFIVMSILYDQYCQLNEEFSKCIGDRGEFSGNFEQFRRRHQLISRSVEEADRFLMISNVAGLCFQIVGVILMLYSAIFCWHETMILGARAPAFYIIWLAIIVFSLSLHGGQAVLVNHTVSYIQHNTIPIRRL